jgi:hypothetical protein
MYRAMSQNLLVPYAPKIFHDKSMNEDWHHISSAKWPCVWVTTLNAAPITRLTKSAESVNQVFRSTFRLAGDHEPENFRWESLRWCFFCNTIYFRLKDRRKESWLNCPFKSNL